MNKDREKKNNSKIETDLRRFRTGSERALFGGNTVRCKNKKTMRIPSKRTNIHESPKKGNVPFEGGKNYFKVRDFSVFDT